MKKTNLYIIALTVAVGAVGITALTPKLTAADGMMGSCCGGMSMSDTSVADPNAKPDLMTTCPVSGNKLGAMGNPLVFTYKGQEVKLCCGACKKDFDKDPAKYMKTITDAEAAQKK